MNKKQHSVVTKLAAATLFTIGSTPAMAAESRGVVDFIKSLKELVTASTDLTYSAVMLLGLVFAAAGILAWIFASKTNNQQQTRGYAGTAFVGGVLLCSIMAVINMGSTTGTGEVSELEAFYKTTQQSSSTKTN